jgi:hypothetical protein
MELFKDNQNGYWIRAAGEFHPVSDPTKIPKDATIRTLDRPPLDYRALRERTYRRRISPSRAMEAIFEFLESPSRPEKLEALLAERTAIKIRFPKPAKQDPQPEGELQPEVPMDPEPPADPEPEPTES